MNAPAPVKSNDPSSTIESNSVAFTFVQALAAELSGGKVELPGFPHIVMRVQKVLADETADSARIVRVIGSEPVLATQLVRMANSAALNPGGRYPQWRQEVAARTVLSIGTYSPARQASRVRCPLLVLVADDDQTALAEPAVRAAQRVHRGELARIPGGHYAPFLDGHEQAVEAELAFLNRHLLETA